MYVGIAFSYRVYQEFGYVGLVLSLSQIQAMAELPHTLLLTLKVGKSGTRIIIFLLLQTFS